MSNCTLLNYWAGKLPRALCSGQTNQLTAQPEHAHTRRQGGTLLARAQHIRRAPRLPDEARAVSDQAREQVRPEAHTGAAHLPGTAKVSVSVVHMRARACKRMLIRMATL